MTSRIPVPLLSFLLCLPLAAVAAAPQADVPPNQPAPKDLPWEDVRLLVDVMQLVKEEYVEPVDDKTLIHGAIRGLLGNLDPHSDFLDKSEFNDMQSLTSGEFNGIGIDVGLGDDNGVIVISPIDGSPAARAGIKSGDEILEVNGTSLDGLSLDQASELMRGKSGTAVTLTLLPEGSDKPRTVKLVREEVHVASTRAELLQRGYGYLRISDFGDDTADGVKSGVRALLKKNGGPLQGMVLDLRDDPGGLLDAAVDVSDDFLDSGIIVSAKGRATDANFVRRATPGDLLGGVPLVVLVNQGTASAAEIVAGALQDNHRALILGMQTFGKGSVQTVIPLPQGDAIKLTTALYYTPSGKSIQAEGIVPDVQVDALQLTGSGDDQEQDTSLKEANLPGHLANTSGAPAPSTGLAAIRAADDLASRDFQLYQALNVLKGLAVLQSHKGP
ncbi:MAG TPA: S41 family peptidase [Gammaproteobacteria bacterium]|nr:S41 family peptidase [Gammaproteobacteria bacterium]